MGKLGTRTGKMVKWTKDKHWLSEQQKKEWKKKRQKHRTQKDEHLPLAQWYLLIPNRFSSSPSEVCRRSVSDDTTWSTGQEGRPGWTNGRTDDDGGGGFNFGISFCPVWRMVEGFFFTVEAILYIGNSKFVGLFGCLFVRIFFSQWHQHRKDSGINLELLRVRKEDETGTSENDRTNVENFGCNLRILVENDKQGGGVIAATVEINWLQWIKA